MKKVVVLSGAGMSAESGVATFRDAGGLWEGHDIMQVASPEGWSKDPSLVLEFYNQRRRQLHQVQPNAGHLAIAALEEEVAEVCVITQNVDNLHEKAGSSKVIHLHGELLKVRSTKNPSLVYSWEKDLVQGDTCELGSQLRPHIVWFGEQVPELYRAAIEIQSADAVLVVGTSMQVYPAAGLVAYAPEDARLYYIDPKPQINFELSLRNNLLVIEEMAGTGVPKAIGQLLKKGGEPLL